MNFLEELQAKYGPQVASQLASRFGIDPEKAADILPRMAPFVLGGVQAQMQHPEDHASANSVLESHADETALDDVDGHFERVAQQTAVSNDTLSGLFGNNAPAAQQAMANQLGVSGDTIAKILPVLAPMILGAVMSKMKGGQGQAPQAQGGGGGGGGAMDILGSILGQQGGGGNILGSVLGSVLGGGNSGPGGGGLASKAGCITSILGMLLKAKK
jgi:hypothetical protein